MEQQKHPERLTPRQQINRVRELGKEALLGLIDQIDTKYADALNGPDDFPWQRATGYAVEAPALTEADLDAAGDV